MRVVVSKSVNVERASLLIDAMHYVRTVDFSFGSKAGAMSGEWGVATTPLNCLEPSDAGAYGVPTNKTTANAVGAHCKAPTRA